MALTIAFIVSLIAAANAGFVWSDDDNNNWSPFQHIKMPNLFFPPIPMPQLPRLPTLPTLPQAPRLPFVGFQMPFIHLPKIPTPAEMASVKPGPNQLYNGVAVKSTSSFTRDKDGNLVKNGGTTILVNDNGEVQEQKTGNNPPNLNDPIIIPPMPEFKPFVMPAMPKMLPINPIDIENHQPGENENYVGSSQSSYSHYSNVDGVESSGGGSDVVVNVNGKVDKEAVRFGGGDKH